MSATAQLRQWLTGATGFVEAWFATRKNATYGLSASRILVGTAALGILMTNFATRHAVWGPGSSWIDAYRTDTDIGMLANVFAGSSPLWFTLKYLLLMAVAVAVIVGWRTRASTALLALGMMALVERNPLVGNQGDNIARIGLLLMVLMSTAEHWSLDARRRRRAEPGGGLRRDLLVGRPVLPTWFTTPLHNAGLLALALQIFILYTASALFKAQGDLWQGGTALYYPLSLHEYAVFPWLNELLTSNPIMVTAATYFAVFIQLFFAVGLLHPITRRVAVIGIILMHVGIAVLMGLPWFSLSMIAFDAIFVSTLTWRRLEGFVGRLLLRARDRWGRRAVQRSKSGAATTTEATEQTAVEASAEQ